MAATDYVGQVYTLLADVLTAGGSATRPIVNSFIRFDKADGNPDRIRNPGPGELRVGKVVWLLDSVIGNRPDDPATFHQCVVTRSLTATFRARIIVDDVRLLPMTSVYAAITADLNAAPDPTGDGRDLGIAGCNTAILETSLRPRRTKSDEDAPDRYRLVGDLLVPVRIVYQG